TSQVAEEFQIRIAASASFRWGGTRGAAHILGRARDRAWRQHTMPSCAGTDLVPPEARETFRSRPELFWGKTGVGASDSDRSRPIACCGATVPAACLKPCGAAALRPQCAQAALLKHRAPTSLSVDGLLRLLF